VYNEIKFGCAYTKRGRRALNLNFTTARKFFFLFSTIFYTRALNAMKRCEEKINKEEFCE
jgi:hypothetical protein